MSHEEDITYVIGIVKTGQNRTEVEVLSQDTIVNFDTMTCLRMASLYATVNFTSSLYVMTWAGFYIESEVVFNLATNIESPFENAQTNFSFVRLNAGKF